MDLHSALTALMGPLQFQLGLPFQHQFLSSLPQLAEQSMIPVASMPDTTTQSATPKKARLEDSSSPLSSNSSTVSSTQLSSPIGSPRRKLAQPIPEEKKDDAYFERRRKNNDAAKRSRDARRQKEEITARRAEQLQQENAQLRAQLNLMKSEMAGVQMLLLSSRAAALAPPTILKHESEGESEQIHV